jgi:hypothetical protein
LGVNIPVRAESETGAQKKRPALFSAGRFGFSIRSASDAGEFFVVGHVLNLELLGVHGRIGAEGQFAEITFLHFDEMLLIFRAQAFEHGEKGSFPIPDLKLRRGGGCRTILPSRALRY